MWDVRAIIRDCGIPIVVSPYTDRTRIIRPGMLPEYPHGVVIVTPTMYRMISEPAECGAYMARNLAAAYRPAVP